MCALHILKCTCYSHIHKPWFHHFDSSTSKVSDQTLKRQRVCCPTASSFLVWSICAFLDSSVRILFVCADVLRWQGALSVVLHDQFGHSWLSWKKNQTNTHMSQLDQEREAFISVLSPFIPGKLECVIHTNVTGIHCRTALSFHWEPWIYPCSLGWSSLQA